MSVVVRVGACVGLVLVGAAGCSGGGQGDRAESTVGAGAGGTVGGTVAGSAGSPTDPSAPVGSPDTSAGDGTGAGAVTDPTGVAGLDDADVYCGAWAVYAGSLQAIAVAQAFGDLQSVQVARLELVAAPSLSAAVNGIAANWPEPLRTEMSVALTSLVGPYERRAQKAIQFMRDAGATEVDFDELRAVWERALRRLDPDDPVIAVGALPAELDSLVAVAVDRFDAALTPFAEDPSLDTSAVSTPLTDGYLAANCPDLASSGIGDPV